MIEFRISLISISNEIKMDPHTFLYRKLRKALSDILGFVFFLKSNEAPL